MCVPKHKICLLQITRLLLQESLDQIEAEAKEKALLGTSRSYQRSIP